MIYANVKHSDYIKLVEKCEALGKENAELKKKLKNASTKLIAKVEVKPDEVIKKIKGGNK